MDAQRRRHVGEILAEALGRSDAQRYAYLREACAGDAELEAEVRSLLDAAHGAGRFLTGADSAAGAQALPAGEGPGTVIGRYKLLQQIGEGGFGVVFLAEQREPVQRRVALKVIKLGMDTRQVIARFEAERQALALMDHPNIAIVLDAGATDGGRPYFVMELVRGDPITEYCDKNNLGVPQRLELFEQVCNAVQHAHQKGIIHRDIKPHNVLVTVADGRPIPKVIDFGVAKATSGRLTEKTLFTEHRALIGTPEYMSPEQAEMSGVDIDTRSDIYSLGVLLYELLTGTTPFDPSELRRAAFDEIQRIIREVEPPKPSTRVSALKDTLASVAAHRRTEPARLPGLIRGDLDWIVMKCLEKDRTRRYETANGLGLDVQRHLAGEPVAAAPPSNAYRLRKLLQRNRGPVAAGVLVLLALAFGLAATLLQAREARRQAARADERAAAAERAEGEQRRLAASERAARAEAQEQRSAAEKAAVAEKERADELKQVSDFQADMLAQVDPTEAGVRLTEDVIGRFEAALAAVPEAERSGQVEAFARQWSEVNATDAARELIDVTILKPAIDAIDQQFKDQPVVDAQLREVLAERYRDLGLYDAAMPLQASALETRRRVLGEEHPDTLASINDMGLLLQAQGKLLEAEPYIREALEKRRRVLGEEHPDTLESINNAGNLLEAQGRLSDAEPYYRQSLEKSRSVLGEEHLDTLISISNMGGLLRAQGRLAEAEPYVRDALEKMRRVLGEEHPNTLIAINNMGGLLRRQGNLTEAEPYYREALEKRRRVMGEEHPQTIASINNMGGLLRAQGRLAEAEPYFREAVEKFRRVLGDEHRETLISINNMGRLLQAQGKLAEAEPYFREALEKRGRVLGEEHPDTLRSLNDMGSLLQAQGKLVEAESYIREALEKRRHVLGDEHPDTLLSINSMGGLLTVQHRFAEAEALLLPGAAVAEAKLPPAHEARLELTATIARLYEAWDNEQRD